MALLGTGAASRLAPQAVEHAQRKAGRLQLHGAPTARRSTPGPARSVPRSSYEVELRDLNRVYALPGSALRQAKLEKFYADQLQLLEKINFDALSQAGKVDYLLLRERLVREQKQLANEARQDAEIAALIPFQQTIIGLEEARRRMETVDPQKSRGGAGEDDGGHRGRAEIGRASKAGPAVLNRAAVRLSQLRNFAARLVQLLRSVRPQVRLVGGWRVQEGRRGDRRACAVSAHGIRCSGPARYRGAGGGRGGGGRGGRGGGGGGRRRTRQRPRERLPWEATRNSRASDRPATKR